MSGPDHSRSHHEDETVMSLSDSGRTFSPDDDLPAGLKVGKYRIRKLIGRGGMGAVYEAMDTVLQREVALKVLPKSLTEDPQALKRFVREAQVAARLNHPNAVTVFDVGRKGAIYYIAMELVRGTSCDELLKRGRFTVEEATRLVADACRALAAAHKAGLIHRDIKPANILRAQDGSIKLADFGLAKLHASNDATLTQKDMVIGTPKYMSPEQCNNERIDARSDLYSLGATYYALLTGAAPYDEGTTMQILFAHCSKPVPDPREVDANVPEPCARVVHRAMAKKPEHRYPSAEAMLESLEQVLDPSRASAAMSHAAVAPIAAAADAVDASPAPNPLDELLDSLSTTPAHTSPAPLPAISATSITRPGISPALVAVIGGGVLVLGLLAAMLVLTSGGGGGSGGDREALRVTTPPATQTPTAAAPQPAPVIVQAAAPPTPAPQAPPEPEPDLPPGTSTFGELVRTPLTLVKNIQPAPPGQTPDQTMPQTPLAHLPPAPPDDDLADPAADQEIDPAADPVYRRFEAMKRALDQAVAANDHRRLQLTVRALMQLHQQLMNSPNEQHRQLAQDIKALLDQTAATLKANQPPTRTTQPPPRRQQ